MNSISKIHFNSSTGVSLNDRFTIMSKVSPSDKIKLSSSLLNGGALRFNQQRSNSVDSLSNRGSLVNRQLLHQLDRRHLGQNSPFRLRNRNIRSGRQRLNRSNLTSRTNLRRVAGNTLSLVGGSRRLQRSNSLSDVATMNADYFERQSLSRSNSQQNIVSRLGNNSRTPRSRSRGPNRQSQRTNSSANLRGRSRSRGARDSSNPRSRSRPRMSRSRSRLPPAAARARSRSNNNGMNGGGNNIENRLGRGRPRGRSSVRRGRGNGNYSRANSRSNTRTGSVNGRLGLNRTGRPIANGFRGGRGRIGKRGMRRGGATYGQNGRTGGMPGRNPQRGARGGPAGGMPPRRGRSRSRGRAASQNRARSGQRGRNASQGRRASAPTKSKEELDKELDQYMANTKSSLDKEMDEYMNGIQSKFL
ncbi:uncharacterized protein LOC128741921 [Sabethes cyaneus]|uniref:uncharacterized protein LOC128741921 n=1 Tax=Sabethes cyaneus TaxID=53552 RepID=UPI00237EC0DB|nr:uncharacterized protein LOC128741921 [Sabethes cyaneus]